MQYCSQKSTSFNKKMEQNRKSKIYYSKNTEILIDNTFIQSRFLIKKTKAKYTTIY